MTSTITGTFVHPDTTPASGSVKITPSVPILRDGSGALIVTAAVVVELDEDGAFSLIVLATDDTDLNPSGWQYRITERIDGAPQRRYFIEAPDGETVDLVSASPVPTSNASGVVILGPPGTPGADGAPGADGEDGADLLLEDDITGYPTRTGPAIFVGETDPGPDGLDVMEEGDIWIEVGTSAYALAADLAAHLADTGDAHDASAVSFSPTGTIAATDVQAAIAEVASEAAGGGSSEILAVKSYNPGADAAYAIASATVADVDATNLAVTFTVPASGKVIVTLSALATNPGSSTSNSLSWSLRESTTTLVTSFVLSAAAQLNAYATVVFHITGLTPGASKTYKWAHSRQTSGTGTTHAGGVAGPAVMTVLAAP